MNGNISFALRIFFFSCMLWLTKAMNLKNIKTKICFLDQKQKAARFTSLFNDLYTVRLRLPPLAQELIIVRLLLFHLQLSQTSVLWKAAGVKAYGLHKAELYNLFKELSEMTDTLQICTARMRWDGEHYSEEMAVKLFMKYYMP